MRSYHKHGDWNAICDRCGFKFKASELKQEWTGLMVCSKDWEARHPLDLHRPPREDTSVPWTRPEPAWVFEPDWLLTESGDVVNSEVPELLEWQ